MLDLLGEPTAIVLVGLLGGLVLGLAARIGRFCTLGMIEDVHYGDDRARLWLWCGALGTAILANFSLQAAGLIDLGAVTYLQNRFTLGGAVIGGLVFGYGMAQAGNCGFGALARLGGGDLRSLVIALVMGVTALVAISGLLAAARLAVFPIEYRPEAPQGLADLVGGALGIAPASVGLAVGAAFLAAAIVFGPADGRIARLFWSVAVGLVIASGFFGTYLIATNGFESWPVTSHTFTAPIGETIHYAMFSTGLAPKFGIGSVIGVILGGFLGSLIRDGFRWEACEDPRELKRQLAGAAMMGLGAVLAAGCSIGQGLSAFSVLSTTAPIVALSIWAGAWLGLRHLILGLAPAP